MGGSDIASSGSVLRSRRPQTRLEASCSRTGRPRRRLLPTSSRTAGEGLGRKVCMNVPEESDTGVLPMNHSNKIEQSMAESEEGRPLIKENIHQSSTRPTQSGARVSQGLAGVRKAAREHKETKFTTLLHHVTVDLLRESFAHSRAKPLLEWTASHGRSMRPGWRIGLQICTAGCIAERIGRFHREGSTSRKATDGNIRSGSPHWKTRSSSTQWSPSSPRSMRRTSSASRMVFVRDAASIRRWMRCPMPS
jgi:hypothetical protein